MAVLALLALLLAALVPARADAPVVALRVGSHADFGRLVFDLPPQMTYRVEQQGERIAVQFDGPAAIRLGAARSAVRNVVSVREADGLVLVEAEPGARFLHFRLGNRLVLDFRDGETGAARPERAARATVPGRAEAAAPAARPEAPATARLVVAPAVLPLPPPLPPEAGVAQRTAPPEAPVAAPPASASLPAPRVATAMIEPTARPSATPERSAAPRTGDTPRPMAAAPPPAPAAALPATTAAPPLAPPYDRAAVLPDSAPAADAAPPAPPVAAAAPGPTLRLAIIPDRGATPGGGAAPASAAGASPPADATRRPAGDAAAPVPERLASLPIPPSLRAEGPASAEGGEVAFARPVPARPGEERGGSDIAAALAVLHPVTAMGGWRQLLERNLRHLGYGPEIRPMQERPFRDAVRAYQRQIGADPTGTLTIAQSERLMRAQRRLSETGISAGPMMFVATEIEVAIAGTWTVIDGRAAHPVNRSRISCQRRAGTCVEAAARVALSDDKAGGMLASDLITYRIVEWLPTMIRAELAEPCVTRTLLLRLYSREVVLLDRPDPHPACRTDTTLSVGIQVLGPGAEPIAQHYDERRASAAADLSPALRDLLERASAGRAETATIASRR
ncbi:hypothetical protein [Roseomonas sp. HF4]|uniref:hypothetical protein n=1 Tax=Roseomonas sp. HF4 TaxID=2562313 RepID=UPI0010BF82B0|nr:hypothetical protein [Roseomonas sp. HF4]